MLKHPEHSDHLQLQTVQGNDTQHHYQLKEKTTLGKRVNASGVGELEPDIKFQLLNSSGFGKHFGPSGCLS